MEQKKEENVHDDGASQATHSSSDSGGAVWYWVVAALIFGGFVGWVIGRQTAPAIGKPADFVAADRQIVETAPISPTAETTESERTTVTLGPTPVSIRPETRRTLGDPDAPVTIVEFSDYQCPFCRRHSQETLTLLKENYIDTGRVYYVFKDFPIASLHPLAYRQHEAALCVLDEAGSEGYWQVHDLFFADTENFDQVIQRLSRSSL